MISFLFLRHFLVSPYYITDILFKNKFVLSFLWSHWQRTGTDLFFRSRNRALCSVSWQNTLLCFGADAHPLWISCLRRMRHPSSWTTEANIFTIYPHNLNLMHRRNWVVHGRDIFEMEIEKPLPFIILYRRTLVRHRVVNLVMEQIDIGISSFRLNIRF